MTFAAGDVVILKSGGQPMTVIGVEEDEAICIWTGDDGDLFREAIPAHLLDEDDEDDAEDEDDGEKKSEDADAA